MPLSMLIHSDQALYLPIAKILKSHQHAQYATLSHQFFISPWPLISYPLRRRILCADIDVVNIQLSLMMMCKSFFLAYKNTFFNSA